MDRDKGIGKYKTIALFILFGSIGFYIYKSVKFK